MIDGSQRHLFELPADVTYLNCAYFSPQLRSVTAAARAAITVKERPWEITAQGMFDPVDRLRSSFAALIGGDASGVAVVPSVSYAVQTAANNAPLASGDEVLVLDEQFPSDLYPWRRAAAAAGARVVTVLRPNDLDWAGAVLNRVSEHTKVVAVPTCHWTDGSWVDLGVLAPAVRALGAWLVVDASQSLGADPFSLTDVQPDWLVSVGYKWQLGPYRISYLWVAPEHREGVPLEETWMGRMGSSDFARLVDYTDEYRPGAARYDMGETVDFVTTPMALAALDQVHAWGPASVARYTSGLTDRVETLALESGMDPVPAARRRGHLIGVRFPEGPPPDLVDRLAAAGVFVSLRGSSIRVSPHVYNDAADIDRLFDAITG